MTEKEWSYSGDKGPTQWAKIDSKCGQDRQSPINIYEGDVKAGSENQSFVFRNYETSADVTMALRNNGHTAVVALSGTTAVTVSGGGLPGGEFRAAQFHFHWGNDSDSGSEHLISSSAYPMELHIVHYNTRYSDLNEAVVAEDGLAVLGFMFEVSDVDNRNYSGIVNNLPAINYAGTEAEILAVPLSFLLPQTFRNYYRYPGSLTTPACQESVTWTVFKEPIKISEGQLQKFRSLHDSHNHPLINNYRPVQALNSRTVTANFDPDIHWSYSDGHVDADHWKDYYSNCGADRQSPINIQTVGSQLNVSIPNFIFNNYNSTQGVSMRLKNNGHSALLDITGNVSISGGGLQEVYQAAQFHLHWGSSDMKGSEHTLDSHAYPMEVHIVHFKRSLGRLLDAAVVPEGLAVLGFFFEISSQDNTALKPMIDGLTTIQNPGSSVTIDAFDMDTILPRDKEHFYRYSGSLTTPGCFQTVIWTVFPDTIKISASQMAAFRRLMSSDKDDSGQKLPIVDNFRPVQPLNHRPVFRNFAEKQIPLSTVHWSYHGEHGRDHWYKDYPTCEDKPTSRQSPINIQPKKVNFKQISSLSYSNYNSIEGVRMQIKNTGHSAHIDIIEGHILIGGGGLESTYKAAQLHFHWGSDNKHGSEHLIDGRAYPMEVHIVHYNTIYPDLITASASTNGLAVLGFMYEVTKEANPAYETIVKKLSEIKEPNSTANFPAMPLSGILPADVNEFYRYEGSLTTPLCNETVMWTVFRNAIKISEAQLNTFRSLKSSDIDPYTGNNIPLVDNYRLPQNINNRVVQANFIIGRNNASTVSISSALLIISILIISLVTVLRRPAFGGFN